METFITLIAVSLCFFGMAIGFILKKQPLRKGCSDDPDACKCRNEGKDPSICTD